MGDEVAGDEVAGDEIAGDGSALWAKDADSLMLSDVTIIAQHPNADDPSLVDVVIGAGIEEPDSVPT